MAVLLVAAGRGGAGRGRAGRGGTRGVARGGAGRSGAALLGDVFDYLSAALWCRVYYLLDRCGPTVSKGVTG